ncbi:MAG TPA: ribosomal L7Ae/L30e/S12e/Gadd45 family protein [Candidatus Jeotgalicoccus stercoravium]|nr:ribosomal L7Ae/L30e/S12e/Gadd45 family protein [Candidatus Jeotgalicoccus stercoravium]
MNDKILNYLGLATSAGKTVNGEEKTLEAVKSNKARLVFLAKDAGNSTTKRMNDKCQTYQVTIIDKYTNAELSQATGTFNRVTLAITDKGFANAIKELT